MVALTLSIELAECLGQDGRMLLSFVSSEWDALIDLGDQGSRQVEELLRGHVAETGWLLILFVFSAVVAQEAGDVGVLRVFHDVLSF